ncbi:glycosyltransferase [Streptomyces sioyaensis]|uniref:glycosyltransferase n=1 Tax=Streptomyces sioyaensis TaxID=67364 RepID=UPI0037CF8127
MASVRTTASRNAPRARQLDRSEGGGQHLRLRPAATEPARSLGSETCTDELLEVYISSDAVVAPSRAETYGLVVAEARSLGVPLIGSALGGVQEQVQDGANGLLFPPEDASALACQLGRKARMDSAALSSAAVAREMIELYLSLAKAVTSWLPPRIDERQKSRARGRA